MMKREENFIEVYMDDWETDVSHAAGDTLEN